MNSNTRFSEHGYFIPSKRITKHKYKFKLSCS